MTFRSLLGSYNPLRYYYLNETSGTVATDHGTQGVNGTIHGTIVNVPGLLTDSYDTCMSFNGSGFYIDAPTTNLPTGNSPISLVCVAKFPSNPISYVTALDLGANVANQSIALYFGDAGTNGNKLDCAIHGAVGVFDNLDAALNSYAIWLWGLSYDGSTLILWVNGRNVGQASVSSLNLTYGTIYIGRDAAGAGSDFFGQMSDAAFLNVALNATQWSNLYTALIGGMTTPTSPVGGYGIYEDCSPLDAQAFNRLDKIANAGFKSVINYDLLNAQVHITDVTAYINHANADGIKIWIDLSQPDIWKSPAIAADYPNLVLDGSGTTTQAFDTFIVNNTKSLAGTIGYYIADEPASGDHASCSSHYGYINTADGTKPKLLIQASQAFSSNFWTGTTAFFDSCTVGGDDHYPLGNDTESPLLSTQIYTGIQKMCNLKSIQSAAVLQAFSHVDWVGYAGQTCSVWPGCAPWPNESQEQNQKTLAIQNMTAQYLFWFSYMDIWGSGSVSRYNIAASSMPSQHWNDLVTSLFGGNAQPPWWWW